MVWGLWLWCYFWAFLSLASPCCLWLSVGLGRALLQPFLPLKAELPGCLHTEGLLHNCSSNNWNLVRVVAFFPLLKPEPEELMWSDRLEHWAQVYFIKFNKSKCKDLHLGCGNQYKLGHERTQRSPAEKDLGYWWMAGGPFQLQRFCESVVIGLWI